MQPFVQELQKMVRAWREDGYEGIYPETQNILTHIKSNNFLHEPQREAFETYVYLKEIQNNKSVPQIVALMAKNNKDLLQALGFTQDIIELFDDLTEEKKVDRIGKKLSDLGFAEYGYANYVLALTMGAGKTILMGVLMMYEFIISYKHDTDTRFAKNILLFGPADTGIIEVLKEVKNFDYSSVIPREYDDILLNIKYWYLEKPETPLNPIGNYNVIVTNSSKIIIRNWKDTHKGNTLFDLRKDPVNKRLRALQGLESLAVFVDEAHHSYGDDVSEKLNQSRLTIAHLAEQTNVITVANFTGTPYVKNVMLSDTVYTFGLQQGMEKGILKLVEITNHGRADEVQSEDFVKTVIDTFWKNYGDTRIEGRLPKIAFYTTDITMLEKLEINLDRALRKHKIELSKKLVWHSTFTGDKKKDADYEFARLDTPESDKQFVLLVNKGTEGWNCKSLVAVALYKNSTSNNFVLQASCRCLRRIGDNSVKARIFLSDENYQVLDRELKNNFSTSIASLSGKQQVEVQVDLIVEKKHTVTIKRKLTDILSSQKIAPEKIVIDLKKVAEKQLIPIIQGREIMLNDEGKAVYRDPVAITSEDIQEEVRVFGYYEVIALIQNKTHFSYAEINRVLEANSITKDKLIKAVEKNYLAIYSIADQILSQSIKYEEKVTTIEQVVELTKAFPFKITVKKKNLHESDKQTFSDSLVISREQEDAEGKKSRLGFHINPYNFDSTDELEMFRYLRTNLKDGERVNDVYFTGGVTNEKHNEFYFEYQKNLTDGDRISKYFPDFLIETSFGRHLVLEVKGVDEELTYKSEKENWKQGNLKKDDITSDPLMKEIGFVEFQELNKNFEYHITFKGRMLPEQQSIVQKINTL